MLLKVQPHQRQLMQRGMSYPSVLYSDSLTLCISTTFQRISWLENKVYSDGFQPGAIWALGGHLTMPGDVSGCQSWEHATGI